MADYAIIPRRRGYWIEAIEDGGERRSVDCFASEEAALRRLHELKSKQDAKERRRMAQEASRWHTTPVRATRSAMPMADLHVDGILENP